MSGNENICYKNCTIYTQSLLLKGPAIVRLTLGPAVSNLDLANDQNIPNSHTAYNIVESLYIA